MHKLEVWPSSLYATLAIAGSSLAVFYHLLKESFTQLAETHHHTMWAFIVYFCPNQRVYFKSLLCEHVWVSSEHGPWPQFTCGMGTVQCRVGSSYRHVLSHYSKL